MVNYVSVIDNSQDDLKTLCVVHTRTEYERNFHSLNAQVKDGKYSEPTCQHQLSFGRAAEVYNRHTCCSIFFTK